ncbi:hypothetical protein TcCL_NonESM09907 [Trypanosoma cruzi]|nr:hypothetical protein TcCL_NonESM09907 [Trypanosoma cruzi]
MSNARVVCARIHHNTLPPVGSGLCHTTRHRCNIICTQHSEIRKNVVRVIQDATTTSTVSSRCGHILQNMVHAHWKFLVQLHKYFIVGPSNVGPKTTTPVDIRPWSRQ